jgi:hypothetical protein
MSARPSLLRYLVRDSAMRWGGRASVPLARLAVSASLSTAAVLVLASFALGSATLKNRIAQFGLDALVVRSPLRHVSDPAPAFPALADYGRLLTLKLPYGMVELDRGSQAALAIADDTTLRALAAMEVTADRLPVLITASLPPHMPVRASAGPWWVEARTTASPATLRPLGLNEVLVVRPGDFPLQAAAPGAALILFVRSASAPALEKIAAAVETVIAANPTARDAAPTVQSAVPLLRELAALQASWLGYAALLAAVLAVTIAIVFGSGAILEYEATVYTTALLRSFGVARFTLWLQRYIEAALLANLGGGLALAAALVAARLMLPALAPQVLAPPVLAPVFLALNAGAFLSSLPVAIALRRPVGLVLQ